MNCSAFTTEVNHINKNRIFRERAVRAKEAKEAMDVKHMRLPTSNQQNREEKHCTTNSDFYGMTFTRLAGLSGIPEQTSES